MSESTVVSDHSSTTPSDDRGADASTQPSTDLDDKSSAAMRAASWLSELNARIDNRRLDDLESLFLPDGEWRDLVALTSSVGNYSGPRDIAEMLGAHANFVELGGFELDSSFAPSLVSRSDEDVIEALVVFSTNRGPGRGVVRLIDQGQQDVVPLARTILTTLDSVNGFEERTGSHRPSGRQYSRTFGGPNWSDLRQRALEYHDHEPEVLVVGAGHAGLSVASRLHAIGVDALLVDQNAAVGDNWRNRYHSLTLHNEIWVNHLPYMPFPSTWPMYVPKDMLGNWFSAYADAMELNVWTDASFRSGEFDAESGRWTTRIATSHGPRDVHPRHIVLAMGLSGTPHLPSIPGLDTFAGDVTHSGSFNRATEYAGKHCVVFGTGTSGHDTAQELYESGAAKVTMVQRNPTTVISIEPSSRHGYSIYEEGYTTEQTDLLVLASGSYRTTARGFRTLTNRLRELDATLNERLEAVGFRTDWGADGTGHQMKQLQTGGGFYINVGCSDLIAHGAIDVVQYGDFERISPDGLTMSDGSTIPADLIVLATGYKQLQSAVADFLGPEVAQKVGPIWGFGEDGELRNMWRPTAQQNFWVAGGSFSQSRMYSKVLAQQIALSGVAQDRGFDPIVP